MKNELNSLDEVREKLGHFRISPLAHRIVQVAKNDRAPVQSLGEIITGEPFLAVRLLKLANLMSGLPQTLSTVPQSISILGLDQLKALTQGLSLFLWAPSSSTEEGGEREHGSLERRQLWEHSVGCATLAARMALNVGAVSPPFAFVAGFLHDIGRVVLCRCAKDRFVESMAVAAIIFITSHQ